MGNEGLKRARELTGEGFHYDNLVKMAEHCRADTHANTILGAYVLNRVFMELAEELGDGPILSSEMRKLEARYRTAVNLALEKIISGAPLEEQIRRLSELIEIIWDAPRTS